MGQPAPRPGRKPAPCIVKGDGSLTMRADVPIFADETLKLPLVVVREDRGIQLAWWIEPTREGPTQVETMGQRTLRVRGWAERPLLILYFRHDTALLENHVFVPRGATLDEAVGRDGDRLRVVQHTTLDEPKSVEGVVACGLLRWGWVSNAGAMSPVGTRKAVVGRRLELFQSATGPRVLEVTFAGVPDVSEGSVVGEWAEVSFYAGLVFKGWVKKSVLSPPPPAHGRSGSGHRARAPRLRMKPVPMRIGTVAEDTPLFVGKGTDLREAGVVERGADVRVGDANGELVAFSFDHGYIVAPAGLEFFVAKNTLQNLREEDRNGVWTPPALLEMNEEAD